VANEEHVNRLRQGAAKWNAWRKRQNINIDLSGLELPPHTALSGADLSGTNMSNATLARTNLSNAKLSGANLNGANLYAADLIGADLSDIASRVHRQYQRPRSVARSDLRGEKRAHQSHQRRTRYPQCCPSCMVMLRLMACCLTS